MDGYVEFPPQPPAIKSESGHETSEKEFEVKW